jgi:dihydrofolate reductase
MSSWINAVVASGDLSTEIKTLKNQEGKFILAHGGASFAQSLVQTGLIDEYRLLIHPVILGKGLPLFSSVTAPVYLQLESSRDLASGIIANHYKPL